MQTLLQQKTTRLTNSQRIIQMLRWTELEYATFINETGLQYLEAYIPGDRAGIDALNRSRIFWNWWKNHWAIRDKQFLDRVDFLGDKTGRIDHLYFAFHEVNMLLCTVFPNAIILEESYAIMIDHFNKSVTL